MIFCATGARAANKKRQAPEDGAISLFVRHGFKEVRHSEWKRRPLDWGEEVLIRHAPYTSIYGNRAKTEFLVVSKRLGRTLRIECKWQQSPGSVDEKFPYVYLNFAQAIPENEIIILADGGGAKHEALRWLRDVARSRWLLPENQSDKTIAVMTLAEFFTWANKTLR